MIHPEYRFINSKKELKGDETLTPIYSTIDGIQTGRLKNLIRQALNVMKLQSLKSSFLRKFLMI
jgi:ATP-dependent DNA helicase RecG